MSQTRRLRRESARHQAQLRLRRSQTAARRRSRRPRHWRNLPGLLFQRKTLAVIAALALAAIIAIPVFAPGAPPVTPADVEPTAEPLATAVPPNRVYENPPSMSLNLSSRYGATIRTSRGQIGGELSHLVAPAAANNFYFLARERFYDSARVLSVEPGKWVAIAGVQPDGTTTSPGYSVALEPSGQPPRIGSLAVLDRGDGMGSEFVILLTDGPETDAALHVFGRLNDGLDIARLLRVGDRISSIRVSELEEASGASTP